MTECTQYPLTFQSLKRRKIEAGFSGGDITSDGGVLLLREMDRRLGLLESVSRALEDSRDRSKIVHSQLNLLQQRVYGLCLGYEDLNDHQTLRHDPAIQTAVNRFSPLASQSTLCRLENGADRKALFAVHEVMVQQFIDSFKRAPRKLILDFDATDDRVHGMQEGRFFHGYYDHHCFLPLYVFCGEQLLVNYLRPSNIDGAKHAWAILALLTKRLRQAEYRKNKRLFHTCPAATLATNGSPDNHSIAPNGAELRTRLNSTHVAVNMPTFSPLSPPFPPSGTANPCCGDVSTAFLFEPLAFGLVSQTTPAAAQLAAPVFLVTPWDRRLRLCASGDRVSA